MLRSGGCAVAVLGINSTKITPWGRSRRRALSAGAQTSPLFRLPPAAPGRVQTCSHNPQPRHRSAGTDLGVLVPASPPAPRPHCTSPGVSLRASSAVLSTLHPNLPATVLPKNTSQPLFPEVATGCCPRGVDGWRCGAGALLPHNIVATQGHQQSQGCSICSSL